MPNRRVHVRVGAVVGVAAAGYSAREAPGDQLLAEMFGGLIGGIVGGALPDVLEPALNAHHRQIAHSVAAGTALTLVRVSERHAQCRTAAAAAEARAASCEDGTDAQRHSEWAAFAWRFAAGALIGIVAGYASHLALDAATPRGLPLLGS